MSGDLSVNIGRLKLKNPVTVASGTFGYAEEFKDLINLKELGAVISKTVTRKPRSGNPAPRTCETPAGMLNSIGLENPGIQAFLEEKLPALAKLGPPVIVSIASVEDIEEFSLLAECLDRAKEAAAIEINISCPNVKHSHVRSLRRTLIAQDPNATFEAVSLVRKATKKTLITKLSPNVTDITEIAQAAEEAGADAFSLVNTFSALSINTKTRLPKIAAGIAGLSGPAIRPIAVRMTWELYKSTRLPIIGMGGIMDTESALEFFLAGASAISVGTANFVNPKASIEIIAGLRKYLKENKLKTLKDIIGKVKL